jgi:hypothetical protein
MLCPQEAWSCEITDKPELKLEFNKGCWLRTIVKNDKTQFDENPQLVNPLNVFYAILLLRSMVIIPNIKRLFVDRLTGNPIPRSRYTSMMHKEMQKMGIPPFFTAYSLKHTAIENYQR